MPHEPLPKTIRKRTNLRFVPGAATAVEIDAIVERLGDSANSAMVF
jgi:hypothetical protein